MKRLVLVLALAGCSSSPTAPLRPLPADSAAHLCTQLPDGTWRCPFVLGGGR